MTEADRSGFFLIRSECAALVITAWAHRWVAVLKKQKAKGVPAAPKYIPFCVGALFWPAARAGDVPSITDGAATYT
jgi:hypothetical protein